jgi:ubiquinone biosynthesis protein UbiJ
MVKVALTQLLNHLQTQNTWAAPLLYPFAGQSIGFEVSAFRQQFNVLEDGRLTIAGETSTPDTVVTMMPSTLLRLMAKDESAKSQIKITGDASFASVIAKVLNNIRWDYTDDLSHLIGDIPAENISQFAKKSFFHVKEASDNAKEMVIEYLQEESPVLAKKRHVTEFNEAVDILNSDVARLEKKLNQLMLSVAKYTTKTEHNSSEPFDSN